MQIHQFVDHIAPGDAITYHAFQLRTLFHAQGYDSTIFVNHIPEAFEDDEGVRLYGEFDLRNEQAILLYHLSIFSPSFSYFRHLRAKQKVLIFHNITSPEFFPAGDLFRTKHIEGGYRQLKQANDLFDSAIADSTYNAEVLREAGFDKPITVIPPFVDLKEKFGSAKKHIADSDGTRIISVSQFLYHKKQDDVIKLFQVYRSYFDTNARLYIIGGKHTDTEYGDYVRSLIEATDGIEITGKISLEDLISQFRRADALISMSEHEGFGVPLLEAMYFGVPILAYDTGAVRETLGSGGVLVSEKNYLEMAAVLHKLVTDDTLRMRILKNQKEELKRFDYQLLSKRFLSCLHLGTKSRS